MNMDRQQELSRWKIYLKKIVGNILDEYDEEEEQIVTDADGSYIIEGQAVLRM